MTKPFKKKKPQNRFKSSKNNTLVVLPKEGNKSDRIYHTAERIIKSNTIIPLTDLCQLIICQMVGQYYQAFVLCLLMLSVCLSVCLSSPCMLSALTSQNFTASAVFFFFLQFKFQRNQFSIKRVPLVCDDENAWLQQSVYPRMGCLFSCCTFQLK